MYQFAVAEQTTKAQLADFLKNSNKDYALLTVGETSSFKEVFYWQSF